nr:hypothetical protein [Tanacetum cinerariifolium]
MGRSGGEVARMVGKWDN